MKGPRPARGLTAAAAWALWGAIALATADPATAGDAPAPSFEDRVGTLSLTEELHARGSLGGVTVDRLGYVYVANFRDTLWRISPEGEVTVVTQGLYGASGNAVDGRGRIYQASFHGNSIVRIARTGEIETLAAGDPLEGPVGLVVHPEDGTLFVCNCQGNDVVKITPGGAAETFASNDLFACPNGIAFAEDETLYVTNFNSQTIVAISPEGEVSEFAEVPGGAGNAHLAYSKGFFYVTKILSHKVVKVSLDGEVFPVAGAGEPGHADGAGPEATLHSPNGIAVDPRTDRIYVNTVVGEYSKPRPSRISVRTIDPMSLTRALRETMDRGGLDAAREVYAAYKADPVRGKEDTAAEMVRFAYGYLSKRRVTEGLALFELNAGSYPEDANAQFHLGEAYRYTGQIERAVEQYRRVLELEPHSERAKARLGLLRAEKPDQP
jgi:sugar lactone lactonase YvrE